jgi:predicted RNA-binding protein YlxR (DUF448 family)
MSKKQTWRTCLGCGGRDDKRELIRLHAETSGELVIDATGAGRGGYLHRSQECWRRFVRRKSVYRAFHIEIGKTAKEKLVDSLKEWHGE